MPSNRWIGQAVATREIVQYVPRNISPGDRFQLSDGVQRYGFTYPAIQPEADTTAKDRANRVVEAIVAAANQNNTVNLGGGLTDEVEIEVSNYGGQPSIRVAGLSSGRPVSLVATAVPASQNAIRVSQLQEGSSGKDFVFELKWPAVPTLGKWAVAADGKRPVILAYNASATELKDAIEDFGLPCTSVTVTGSHSAGYVVTLSGLTAEMPNPPLLFPIVPPPRIEQVVEVTLYEHSKYRFGETSYEPIYLEADASAAEFKTYLLVAGLSSIHLENITVVRTEIAPTSGYSAGAVYEVSFNSDAAFDAFMALPKFRIGYTFTDKAFTSAGTLANSYHYDFDFLRIENVGGYKIRLYHPQITVGGSTLNPFNRFWHTKAFPDFVLPGVPDSRPLEYVIDSPVVGYDSQVTIARTTQLYTGGVPNDGVDVVYRFTMDNATVVNLTSAQIVVAIGLPDAEVPLTVDVITGEERNTLGVNNNAGYKITTVSGTGITNKVVLIPALDLNHQSLYQFEWNGLRSHRFTGASKRADIIAAAESIFGAGNVAVSLTSSGQHQIEFCGEQSEVDVEFSVILPGSSAESVVVVEPQTPMKQWVLRYQFLGGVCSGKWRFRDALGTPAGPDFSWLTDEEVTGEDILDALTEIEQNYGSVLEPTDVEVVTEAVGRKFLVREFTITFQAQPYADMIGEDDIPFWIDIDVSDLLTAEPALSVTSVGQPQTVEIQSISIEHAPTSGTWRLTYNGANTTDLSFNASAANVQSALIALGQTVTVVGASGGPYRVIWTNPGERFLLTGTDLTLASTSTPVFDMVVVQPGTGPNHFDNADNWSLGRTPADGDRIVFADGSVSCLYGLQCSTVPTGVDVYRSWTGNLGLSEVREDGSVETLPNWLHFSAVSANTLPVRIGLGESGEGPAVCRISVGNRPIDGNVLYTQTGTRVKAVALKGTHANNKLVCVQGDVAFGVRPEDACSLELLQLVPGSSGEDLTFYASEGASIVRVNQMGGAAILNKPPTVVVSTGGTMVVNGDGACELLDLYDTNVRWLASGVLGKSGAVEAALFGDTEAGLLGDIDGGDAFSTFTGGGGLLDSSSVPTGLRITSTLHGLTSGDRVYIRAYSGVVGVDGKTYSVRVIDEDTFDLIAVSAFGTLVGYEGQMHWGVANTVRVRGSAVLDFDSDGRSRDIVAPVIVQGTGVLSDLKGTIVDLRMWPEQVESLLYLGTQVELRRVSR